MRKLYLIRHGKPDFADKGKWCIGRTDIPLGKEGHLQGCLLGFEFEKYPITKVFCSFLTRSVETARYLCEAPIVWQGLEEPYAGEWDGLSFAEIKKRWPQVYEARGKNLQIQPPGAEESEITIERFMKAIYEILDSSNGDIAIVAHKTVIQLFLCRIASIEMANLPYASITTVVYEENTETFTVETVGEPVHPALTEEICERLLESAGASTDIKKHCRMVAEQAKKIAEELREAGYILDENEIVCGAQIHDIARNYKNHSQVGADWIRELGYEKIAEIILQHHNLPQCKNIDESAIVYLADKCVQADKVVSIEERFEQSLKKCKDEEAKEAHRRRYERTVELQNKIRDICRNLR